MQGLCKEMGPEPGDRTKAPAVAKTLVQSQLNFSTTVSVNLQLGGRAAGPTATGNKTSSRSVQAQKAQPPASGKVIGYHDLTEERQPRQRTTSSSHEEGEPQAPPGGIKDTEPTPEEKEALALATRLTGVTAETQKRKAWSDEEKSNIVKLMRQLATLQPQSVESGNGVTQFNVRGTLKVLHNLNKSYFGSRPLHVPEQKNKQSFSHHIVKLLGSQCCFL